MSETREQYRARLLGVFDEAIADPALDFENALEAVAAQVLRDFEFWAMRKGKLYQTKASIRQFAEQHGIDLGETQ